MKARELVRYRTRCGAVHVAQLRRLRGRLAFIHYALYGQRVRAYVRTEALSPIAQTV
jgi:hypothetical protein